ncbi:uncharacterized protein Jv isoform X2 [Diachasmimorpha longicaudata]|uniref:uncharacterized protein Jv isoform X2 n=1 Tax=Diachasmimorpha longicaudata TaxID=58733 RepID=UPI0030B87F0C
MGGIQSGGHNLGDALWLHERQRQKDQREIPRHDSQNEGNSENRRKLLKRTRSLAIISEDSRNNPEVNCNFSLSELTFELPRRPQLIPRAKLIDRNSLKDRLSKSQQHLWDTYDRYHQVSPYHSHSICNLHSGPSTLPYLPQLPCNKLTKRKVADKLNILDWPRTPRRYCSHQDLDTVSGLVDIIEDDWPLNEGQRDIYTQVKRKRKEHRSLDSILFEDERELEYFDVLNLLPLSKVRLEFDETDTKKSNFTSEDQVKLVDSDIKRNETSSDVEAESIKASEPRQTPRILHVSEFSDDNQDDSLQIGSHMTDEEKCKGEKIFGKSSSTDEDSLKSDFSVSERRLWKTYFHGDSFDTATGNFKSQSESREKKGNENSFKKQVVHTRSYSEKNELKSEINNSTSDIIDENVEKALGLSVEQSEDFQSLWISDSEEADEMSRRPQVLKIIESEVTRKRIWGPTVIEIDDVAREETHVEKTTNNHFSGHNIIEADMNERNENNKQEYRISKGPIRAEPVGALLESKFSEEELSKLNGKFKKNIKDTSSDMIEKSHRSLEFETISDTSDLGLGSDSNSDIRPRSIDDGVDNIPDTVPICKKSEQQLSIEWENRYNNVGNKSYPHLSRSRSCVNSLEGQNADAPEFDHVRYKIIKSRLFGKNIYGNILNKGNVGYEGLMQYLRDYSFSELLLDNNVVIIEPVRAEHVDMKVVSGVDKEKTTCNLADTTPKKSGRERCNNLETIAYNADSQNATKQSSLRKHFYYHPISSLNRINRELIDEELPHPDTVRNVRKMFEAILRPKCTLNSTNPGSNCKNRKSLSMKDLSIVNNTSYDNNSDNNLKISRSRSSSTAKNLMRLFEGIDRTSSAIIQIGNDDVCNNKNESKTRIIAQSFEARSRNTSPSNSGCARNKVKHYRQPQMNHRHHLTNWDAGSVSSGVSSDYPDTDPGSEAQCTSSEDEDIDVGDNGTVRTTERVDGHYVSPDVLKKIREYGTSVTYYGGKVVNTCNGPLVSPTSCKILKKKPSLRFDDYVKFRLVKSNSCDSRLELTGKIIERKSNLEDKQRKNYNTTSKSMENSNLRDNIIVESSNTNITNSNIIQFEDDRVEIISKDITKREPPIVIGLEPKKDDNRDNGLFFKTDFRIGKIDYGKSNIGNKITSALTKWQINEHDLNRKQTDFGNIEFEEFEVLEDSLNGADH